MKQKDEHSQTVDKLKQDWKQLDELTGNPSTSRFAIKQELIAYQEKQKKKFYKELIIFFTFALCLLSFFLLSIVKAPILFIVVELAAIIIGPIVYVVLVNKRKKEREILS